MSRHQSRARTLVFYSRPYFDYGNIEFCIVDDRNLEQVLMSYSKVATSHGRPIVRE